MADAEKKEGAAEGGEAKPKSKKMLIIIIVAVVVLLASGGVTAVLLSGGGEEKKEHAEGEEHEAAEPEEEHVALQSFEMEPIIVNLSTNSSFLKVKMLIEFNPALLGHTEEGEGGGGGYGGGGSGGEAAEGPAGPPHQVAERMPMIKDSIITVLSSKKPEDVLSAEGKESLKEELIEAINDAIGLEEGPVVNIYFLEFIIQ